MAEVLLNELASGKAVATSAGTKPADRVNPNVVKAMKEIGINISHKRPKLLTSDMVEKAEKLITMGCVVDACPVVPKEVEDWKLEDPSGKSMEKFREIRDEIKKRVEKLVKELG